MITDKPIRRLTLRQLLTQSEKCTRDLIETVHSNFLTRVNEFRDLSRPVRRRSHYPTVVALHNSLRHLTESADQTMALAHSLTDHLEAVREHALKERTNRRY